MSAPVLSHLEPEAVHRAAEILGNGGLVALPTETVYGLGASIESRTGVQRVFAAKGRPSHHPLIVHGSSPLILDHVADQPSTIARYLADAVWPGPLSLLVPRSGTLDSAITGSRDTVVVRVPAHDFFRTVVDQIGRAHV